jgi:diketogulonate reductase-like aldo/keto reductase
MELHINRPYTICQETFTLSNGVKIPKLGLGTWMINNDSVARAIIDAVKIGYRHIDTAQAYQNETGVGEGVATCGVNRADVFVTSKVAAELKNYSEVAHSIDESLKKLKLDYLDLMIIHSPRPWADFLGKETFFEGNREAWRALEDAYKAGKLRAIGLSNFEKYDIDNILTSCTVKPMVNQILAHISNTPVELIKYCHENNILVEAYSPIGHGELLKNQEIASIAERYHVSVAQLSIRYDLQLGLLPLPKTVNPEHMKSNADVDFVILENDMDSLKNIQQIEHYGEHSKFPVFGRK